MLKLNEYCIAAPVGRELCFAFVSDLHDAENEPILAAIKRSGAKAVLAAGDVIHDSLLFERGIEFLRRSAELYPTFCSLGNHEMKFDGDIRTLILGTGAVLLDNSWYEYGGIIIGGLTSGYKNEADQGNTKETPPPDLTFLKKFASLGGFKLLLCHHPEYFDKYIKNLDVGLTLSGHAHGGQWRFFGRGLFSPGQGLFPKYTSGLYCGKLIVGRGIGNPQLIPRINNPPEVILVRLIPERG